MSHYESDFDEPRRCGVYKRTFFWALPVTPFLEKLVELAETVRKLFVLMATLARWHTYILAKSGHWLDCSNQVRKAIE